MRDKLIELLKHRRHLETSELADVLLENGIIVPPCKVGDTVYYETFPVDNGSISVGVQPHKIIAYRLRMVTEGNCLIADFEIGKTVFLTREEAERALKGGGEG